QSPRISIQKFPSRLGIHMDMMLQSNARIGIQQPDRDPEHLMIGKKLRHDGAAVGTETPHETAVTLILLHALPALQPAKMFLAHEGCSTGCAAKGLAAFRTMAF